MHIKQIAIKNFRSLKDINLFNLENLVILIGENGSGKTNIFEAMDIFLNQFDSPYIQNKGLLGPNWYLWHHGNTDSPIEFKTVISGLSKEQTAKLSELSNVKQLKGDLTLNRSIICNNDKIIYRNDSIEWGSVIIRGSEKGYKVESEPGFDPNPFIDAIMKNVINKIYTYIPIGRGIEIKTPHGSILAFEVRNELMSRGQDTTPKGMKEWNKITQGYNKNGWTSGQLECKGGQLLVPHDTTDIPYEFEGAGYQALFNLLRLVEMGGQIVAVEEPENHMHPRMQKTLVHAINNLISSEKQIFLSTHSPFIFNMAHFSSIWSLYSDGIESKIQNVSTQEDISDVLHKLGIKPSDLLFANGILIVEGPTDKEVFTNWANQINKHFGKASIIIIDAEGAGNIKKYLTSEVIQKTCIEIFALCDQNSEKEVRKAVKGIINDDNIFILKQGDLEDYYPRELVMDFIKEMLNKKGKSEKEMPSDIKVGETVKKLDEILGKDTSWKKYLARKIREEMKPDQINKEIIDKLNAIYKFVIEET